MKHRRSVRAFIEHLLWTVGTDRGKRTSPRRSSTPGVEERSSFRTPTPAPHGPRTPASYELPISPKSANRKHRGAACGQFFVTEVERAARRRRRRRLRSRRLTRSPWERVPTHVFATRHPPAASSPARAPASNGPGAHSSGPPGAPLGRTGARGAGRPRGNRGTWGRGLTHQVRRGRRGLPRTGKAQPHREHGWGSSSGPAPDPAVPTARSDRLPRFAALVPPPPGTCASAPLRPAPLRQRPAPPPAPPRSTPFRGSAPFVSSPRPCLAPPPSRGDFPGHPALPSPALQGLAGPRQAKSSLWGKACCFGAEREMGREKSIYRIVFIHLSVDTLSCFPTLLL